MLNPDAVSVGCTYYEVDGYYWVVLLVKREPKVQSADEWNAYIEEATADGDLKHEEVTNSDGETVDVYIEGDGGVVMYQATEDEITKALREAGLIP